MKPSRRKREDKLYKQWVKHGDLPPEAIPQKESSGALRIGREKTKQGRRVLYILLGLGIFTLCIGLVLLVMQSC